MASALIYGGCGQLGKIVVKAFKDAKWKTVAVDLIPSDIADHSITIKGDGTKEDASNVVHKLRELKIELDSVISVAGGFTMAKITDEAVFSTTEKMVSFNFKSALAAAHVASHTLKPNGLLVLTGAYAALSPTPAFIGYGISKAATHHLVESLAHPDSGMPKGAIITSMLPVTLDTPQNRKDMPNANFDDWTPLEDVANLLVDWSSGKGRPTNGSFMQIKTTAKKTSVNAVQPVKLA